MQWATHPGQIRDKEMDKEKDVMLLKEPMYATLHPTTCLFSPQNDQWTPQFVSEDPMGKNKSSLTTLTTASGSHELSSNITRLWLRAGKTQVLEHNPWQDYNVLDNVSDIEL